jgi:hypothetical protein
MLLGDRPQAFEVLLSPGCDIVRRGPCHQGEDGKLLLDPRALQRAHERRANPGIQLVSVNDDDLYGGVHCAPPSVGSGSIDFDKQVIFGKEIGGGRLFPGDASRAIIACDSRRRWYGGIL